MGNVAEMRVIVGDKDRETERAEELRILEMIRHRLTIDRLIAAGIERGARARFQPL